MLRTVLAWSGVCFLVGCASLPAKQKSTPVLLESSGSTVEFIDQSQRVARANVAFEAGKFDQAIEQYRKLLVSDHRANTSLIRYNLALALRRADRLAEADVELKTLVEEPGTAEALRKDARFLWTEVAMAQKNWTTAQAILAGLTGKLENAEQLEKWVKQAVIEREQARVGQAEATLMQGWKFYQKLDDEERAYLVAWGAEMRYLLATLSHRHFLALPIRLPQSQLENDLEQKARALLVAQNRYFETMKLGDAERASAAAFQIGVLYAQFYDVLLNAPVPVELEEEGKAIYREELERKIVTLLEKSLSLHRRNILMAERLGLRNAWVRQSIEQADTLQKKLDSHEPIITAPLQSKKTPEADVVPRHVL